MRVALAFYLSRIFREVNPRRRTEMPDYTIPDLSGWEAYCRECEAFREARRAQERDASAKTEYFEVVCNTCRFILLTFRRAELSERFDYG